MWIVKLGGSLDRNPLLCDWLEMLALEGRGRVVIVPGGGRFADVAREAQQHWGFDDLAGHNLAVLGMAQMAQMLKGLCPALRCARDETEIRAQLAAGAVPVWMPLDLLREAPDELTNWGVTSDSLALRLAARLQAEGVIMVKSCAVPSGADEDALVQAGIVDTEFAAYRAQLECPVRVVSATDWETLPRLMTP